MGFRRGRLLSFFFKESAIFSSSCFASHLLRFIGTFRFLCFSIFLKVFYQIISDVLAITDLSVKRGAEWKFLGFVLSFAFFVYIYPGGILEVIKLTQLLQNTVLRFCSPHLHLDFSFSKLNRLRCVLVRCDLFRASFAFSYCSYTVTIPPWSSLLLKFIV